MSGTPEQNQDIYAIRKTPADRARIQKKLKDQMETMSGDAAVASDIEAFFAGRPDDDFLPEKCSGLKGLDNRLSRLDSVRLYMVVFGGYKLEEVMSQSPDMMAQKQAFGKEFCDILTSGDPDKTGEMWREMTLHLNSYKMSKVDFYDDESMVDHYREVKFYSDNSFSHFNAMSDANTILHKHRGAELAESEKNSMGAELAVLMVNGTMYQIGHERYLSNDLDDGIDATMDDAIRRKAFYANSALRARYGGEFNMLQNGNFGGIADRSKVNDQYKVDMNRATMNPRAMPTVGGKFGSGANYQQIYDDLMDIEEISSAEMGDTSLIDQRGPDYKAAKHEISLMDLNKEAIELVIPRGKVESQIDFAETLATRQRFRDMLDWDLSEKYARFGRDIPKKEPIVPNRKEPVAAIIEPDPQPEMTGGEPEPRKRRGFVRFFRNNKNGDKPIADKVPLEYGEQANEFANSGDVASARALEAYKSGLVYEQINRYMRGVPYATNEGLDNTADASANIRKMFDREGAKLEKGHVLFRWTHFPAEVEALGADKAEGKVITDKAIISTSLHREDLFFEPDKMLMKIYAKTGTPAVFVPGNIGLDKKTEEEVILAPDTKFRIIGMDKIKVDSGDKTYEVPYIKVEALAPHELVKDEDLVFSSGAELQEFQKTPAWKVHLDKKQVLNNYPGVSFKILNNALTDAYEDKIEEMEEVEPDDLPHLKGMSDLDKVIHQNAITPNEIESKLDAFLKQKALGVKKHEENQNDFAANTLKERYFPSNELKNRYFGEPVKTLVEQTELNPQANRTVGNTQTPAVYSKPNDTPKLDNPPLVKKN